MPLDFPTATQAELDLERNAVHLALQKQTTTGSWSKVVKSVATELLHTKTDLEDIYRLLASADLATVTGQQKTDFLLKLKSAALKITNAYQVTYISLSDAPDTAEEFLTLDSCSGLSPEQTKKITEIRKKKEDLADKAEQKAQKVSFFNSNRNKPYYQPKAFESSNFQTPMNFQNMMNLQNPLNYHTPYANFQAMNFQPKPRFHFSGPPPPLALPNTSLYYNSAYPGQTQQQLTYVPQPNLAREKKKLMIEQEKLETQCKDCDLFGHWRGDARCPLAVSRVAGYMLHS